MICISEDFSIILELCDMVLIFLFRTKLLFQSTKKRASVQFEYEKLAPGASMEDRNDADSFQNKQFSSLKDPPKFVCNILHSIAINPQKAKDIIQNKERYWRYLKNISRTVKGNFNPWILNSMYVFFPYYIFFYMLMYSKIYIENFFCAQFCNYKKNNH